MRKNRIPSMLLALFLAVCLWIYIVMVVDPNDSKTVYSVPVTYENLQSLSAKGLLMSAGQDATVTLSFYGRRSELAKLTSKSITVTADLSQISQQGEQTLAYTVNLPDDVSSRDITLDQRSPARLSLVIEPYAEKEFEIKVQTTNEIPRGYVADMESLQADPQTLTVRGPAQAIEQISQVQVTVDIADAKQTIDGKFDFTLLDAEGNEITRDGLQFAQDRIHVTLPVLKYKEIPLTLDLTDGGGATEENVEVSLSPSKITISGPEELIDSIQSLSVGTLDLSTLSTLNDTQTYEIKLPEGVNSVTGETQVTAKIKITDLTERQFEIDQFEVENEPEGMTATVKTTVLTVTLRGVQSDLNSIQPEDLTATADLTDFTQAGTYVIPVRVTVKNYPKVGAVGSASITVTIE